MKVGTRISTLVEPGEMRDSTHLTLVTVGQPLRVHPQSSALVGVSSADGRVREGFEGSMLTIHLGIHHCSGKLNVVSGDLSFCDILLLTLRTSGEGEGSGAPSNGVAWSVGAAHGEHGVLVFLHLALFSRLLLWQSLSDQIIKTALTVETTLAWNAAISDESPPAIGR